MVHQFSPLNDTRWDTFLARHVRASLFHSSPWLKALNQTYGYPVVGYTTSAPGEELKDAVVFCRVESWLTGRRLVSLPFSDHCEPLVDRQEDLQVLIASLEEKTWREKWNYMEMRPLTPITVATPLRATTHYTFHELDLQGDLGTIFRNLHKDSIQRKIRRAEREKLSYAGGTDAPPAPPAASAEEVVPESDALLWGSTKNPNCAKRWPCGSGHADGTSQGCVDLQIRGL
jgi:hypothetical protein